MTRPDPSSIEAAKARYEAERAKRLRDEGLAPVPARLGEHHLDRDPWADPDFTRDPITEEVDVVVLGGGCAGMLAGINLVKRGITNFRIVDKAADFGGTWYWNRYPGCMCDVDATIYLPLLEETGYMPDREVRQRHRDLRLLPAPRPALRALRARAVPDRGRVADLGRRRAPLGRRRPSGATGSARSSSSRPAASCTRPSCPASTASTDFAGKAFHTTRWDYDYTGGSPTEPMDRLADKVVGIIGTGATSVQVVPQLARSAKEVYVFQRTPSAVGVRGQQPIDEAWFRSLPPGWQAERTRNFTAGGHRQQARPRPGRRRLGPGAVARTPSASRPPTRSGPSSRRSTSRSWRASGDASTRSSRIPSTAEKLKPWYGKHCKRICFHDEYLAVVQPAERAPGGHRRPGRARDVRRRAGRGRHRVPARPAGVRLGVRDHDRPGRPPRVRPGRSRRRAA